MLRIGAALVAISFATTAQAQLMPVWGVDGVPIACAGSQILADPNLPDVGMARPGVIFLNPAAMWRMSTSHKLFVVAHECAHALGVTNEREADCFGIRLGRDQGWWPPQAFPELIDSMRNSSGDFTHDPGPQRLSFIMQCYNS